MKSLHIAIVAPYSYQPFRSIRQICSLFERELKNLGHTVTVLSPPSVLGDMTKGSGLVHKILSGFERTFFSPMGLVSRLQKLRRAARREKSDFIVLLSDQALAPLNFSLSDFKVIQIVNDLTAIRAVMGEFGQNNHSFGTRYTQQTIVNGLAQARRFICVSNATAADLRRLIPLVKSAPIDTTPLPLCHPFRRIEGSELAEGLNHLWRPHGILPPDYILHVGSDAWYKNRTGLIEIARELKNRRGAPLSLVFAGAPPSANERSLIEKYQIRFHYFEGLSNDELNFLYCGASIALSPSFAEGFCWPALEALASGTPLAITDIPVLTENFADAASLIFPEAPLTPSAEWITSCADGLEQFFNLPAEEREAIITHGLDYSQRFSAENFRQRLAFALQNSSL